MKNKRKQLGSTGKKQVEVLKIKTFQIKNHRQQTILPHQEKWEIKMLYKGFKTTHDFRKFNAIRVFGMLFDML